MATIQYDAAGFPEGELVHSGEDHDEQAQQTGLLRDIRSDVRSIAHTVGVQVAQARRAMPPAVSAALSQRGGMPLQAVAPRGRAPASTVLANGSVGGRHADAASSGSRDRAAPPAARDSRGRFTAGTSKDGSGDAAASPATGTALTRLSEGVSRLSASISGAENVDPTLAAASEVKQAVAPLGRGFSFLYGRNAERRKERWYQRFLKALTGRKTNESQPLLARGGGGLGLGGGGLLGTLGGLFGRGAGAMGRGVRGLGGLLGRGARGLGGMLRRVPVLGALLSGGMALGSLLGLDDDPNATPQENRTRRFRGTGEAAGMGVGGVVGAVLGSALGPVGTVAGGWLGSLLGEKVGGAVGDWARQLMDSGVPDKMLASWDAAVATMGQKWTAFTDWAQSSWASVTTQAGEWWARTKATATHTAQQVANVAEQANTAIKARTGIDVAAKVSEARVAAIDTASRAGSAVVEVAKQTGAALMPATVKRGLGLVGRAGANATAVLQAGRDAGLSGVELANFMAQNAHESAGFTRLTENLNYRAGGLRKTFGKYFKTDGAAQAAAGNAEAIANRVYGGRMGNTEAGDGFRFRGRGFIQLTGKSNYEAAGQALGIDLVNRPELAADPAIAAKVSAWYWRKNVSARGAGDDVVKATRAVNGGMNGLADRVRKAAEWQGKLSAGVAGAMPAGAMSTIAAGALPRPLHRDIPPAVPLQIPPMPELKEPPTQLNKPREKVVVVAAPVEPGQNPSDRALAHIVTGGLGLIR